MRRTFLIFASAERKLNAEIKMGTKKRRIALPIQGKGC
jgi:hypothetical protein